MARLSIYSGLIAGALVLQLSVLDALPFPNGVAPDLVLLIVVAIALTGGPLPGLVTGFAGGLALDLAPPVAHAVGTYALVFCLIGYVCGQAAGEIDRSVLLPLAAMAFGVVAGLLMYTVVGVTFGEPDVTWAAARHVLPLSVTYDILLSPFVLYLVMRLVRWATHGAQDPAAALVRSSATQALRNARGRAPAPREPKIRPGYSGWIGTTPAARMLAAGRPFSDAGLATGGRSWRRAPQAGAPRLRIRSARSPAVTPERFSAGGVFSGGSVVGDSAARLRLRPSRPSLRSRLVALAGMATRTGGKRPRFGRRRFQNARPLAGFRRAASRLSPGRTRTKRSLAWPPGQRRTGGLR